MIIEIKIPSPGESVTEVAIGNWLVQDGDIVDKDQEIADVETPNHRATSANDSPIVLTNCCAISERTRGISPRRPPIRSSSTSIFSF